MAATKSSDDILVELVDQPQDIDQGFDCMCATFGRQTKDAFWMCTNPGWDTPEGKAAAVDRMVERWRSATKNSNGQLNTVFLKATAAPAADGQQRRVVGLAIWAQLSVVPGYGDVPPDLMPQEALEKIRPGDEVEQRFIRQADASLHRRRLEVVKEKATATPPAVMVLDLCIVDPAFQGRGIATRMVQWGLDEAKRRGGLEAITEASVMGRSVYRKLGLQPEDKAETEIVWDVDPEFANRQFPPNLFLRSRPPQ